MTITTHIAEILRQGIWASLTGGWYYEPAHSIFCNTVHLYLWLALFALPLVLGMILSGSFHWGILIGYSTLITVIFAFLKGLVYYFHIIFDTSEPIITTKEIPPEEETTDEAPSLLRRLNLLTNVNNQEDGIKMQEIRRSPHRDRQRRSETRSRLMDSASRHSSRRRVRIEFEPRDENMLPLDYNDVEVDMRDQTSRLFIPATDAKLLNALRNLDDEEDDRDHDQEEITVREFFKQQLQQQQGNSLDLIRRIPSLSESRDEKEAKLVRKYSEPALPVHNEWHCEYCRAEEKVIQRRSSSDAGTSRVRRAYSTFEPRNSTAKDALLSEHSLAIAKEATHKSYPNKISSDDDWQKLSKKPETATCSFTNVEHPSDMDEAAHESEMDNEVAKYTANSELQSRNSWKDSSPRVFGPQESRCSSRSKSSEVQRPMPVMRAGTPIDPYTPAKIPYDTYDMPSTSSGWMPVVVKSINEEDKPGTSAISNPMDPNSGDFKVEITKFLEELIEKHPETLDVIENVRMNRMGRAPKTPTPMVKRERYRRRSSSSTAVPPALSDLTQRDGTHVATGHEDTSQGALHSFQDEDGNWWTYAFDEQGVGTAQPLGSANALMEMIQRGRRSEIQSSEEEIAAPSTSKAHESSSRSSRRERALSSSSNESYTYIPSVPTSVFHAGTGTGASRGQRGHISLSQISQRFRLPTHASLRRQNPQESSNASTQQDLDHLMDMLQRRRSLNDQRGSLQGRLLQLQDRMFNSFDYPSSVPSRTQRRIFQDLQAAYRSNPPSEAPLVYRRQPTIKRNYYYQMKILPKMEKSFKIKMDRLSISALFDRNRGIVSCVFDTVLAMAVSILAVFVLSTGIYYDISLCVFAAVVAGAHFSLLKSVQPDAASPIHGFNWLVAYSRPVYFCLLCAILLGLNFFCDDPKNNKFPWNWNPYTLKDASNSMVLLAFRDLVGTMILILPACFTCGWLPQVNTLAHHIFEQIEMHIFGGTASLGVLSASIQLVKSIVVYSLLTILCHVAYHVNPTNTQTLAFSAFLAISVGLAYWMSRFSSNPQLLVMLFQSIWEKLKEITRPCRNDRGNERRDVEEEQEVPDPFPDQLKNTVSLRARHDFLFGTLLILTVFALHSTSLFTATRPYFIMIITGICCAIGIFNHYGYMQLRAHTPWKLLAKPVFRSAEFSMFEASKEAKLMTFERIHVWSQKAERNICYPLLIMSQLSDAAWQLPFCAFLTPLIALRLFRGGFSHPQLMYVPLLLSYIATRWDWAVHLPFGFETTLPQPALFVLSFYIITVLYPKWLEFYMKMNFIMAYVAPWQISWGSAFHAFAQPFSIPHSALVWVQTFISSVISAPMNPFLGSSFFMISYVRPTKFWERDYNTKRSDASNTRLSSQIDRGPMVDDSNLNAVFYEHLTRSLQKSLAGDLLMGRWATSVEPGDCFILASFYLNCLVHIIEVGNGFVTFQLRGLEFRGTYCHQREVEAISEDQTEGTGFCCCSPGSLPGFLSLNTAWSLRWLAWEVVAAKYVVDGYSITDNSAVNLLQVHELRRLLVTLYVKCIIFYASTTPKLTSWLSNEHIKAAIIPINTDARYADVDHIFCPTNDEDWDHGAQGISKLSFTEWYNQWINYCLFMRRANNPDEDIDHGEFLTLCFMLSILGRRALSTAAHNRHSTAAESFLYGLHALFKGDFRIHCPRDEWVFADMDLLRLVISPAVKMALKLHQDHFAATDDFDEVESLHKVITDHQEKMFISHEQDPAWRRAILSNTSSLLALRHMYDDGQDDYKIIMLNKMHLNMRVIKLNRECVRAFWSGQQQELIYLRNRNPERGSIQNARQVLRNMINSSADQPVGYPIYVSPLTTSFVDTHNQISRVVGPTITLEAIGNGIRRTWQNLRKHLGPSTSSNQGGCAPPTVVNTVRDQEAERLSQGSQGHAEQSVVQMNADGSTRVTLAKRPQSEPPGLGKKGSSGSATAEGTPSTSGKRTSVDVPPAVEEDAKSVTDSYKELFLCTQLDTEGKLIWIEITDLEQVFKYLNEPLKSTGHPLVEWPSEVLREMANHKAWFCQPQVGMVGRVIYTWFPNHPNKKLRSHIGDVIYLVAVPDMANALLAIGAKGSRRLNEKEVKRVMVKLGHPEPGIEEEARPEPPPRVVRATGVRRDGLLIIPDQNPPSDQVE